MDLRVKHICIKCDQGGKLLVCSDNACPISIHEKCMNCPARFDSLGNFYCPYCFYKQAIAQLRQAQEKVKSKKRALSNFLDMEVLDGDQLSRMTGAAEGKELSLSKVAGNVNLCDDENMLNILNGDKREALNTECTNSTLPCEEAEISLLNKQNNALPIRCDDTSKLNPCMVIVDQNHSKAIADYRSEDISSRVEDTMDQSEIVRIGNKVQALHQIQVHNNQDKRIVGGSQQEAGLLGVSPLDEEAMPDGTPDILKKRKRGEVELIEETEGKRAEKESLGEAEDIELQENLKNRRGDIVKAGQHGRVVCDQQEVRDLIASPVEEVIMQDGIVNVSKKRKQSEEEMLEENKGRRVEQLLLKNAEETSTSFVCEELELQASAEATRVKTVEACQEIQAGHQLEGDDNQHDIRVGDKQEARHMIDSLLEEKTTHDGTVDVSENRKPRNVEVFDKTEGRKAQERFQEQVEETVSSFTNEEPELQVQMETDGGSDTAADEAPQHPNSVLTGRRRIKIKAEKVVKSVYFDSPTRSLRSRRIQNKETKASNDFKQFHKSKTLQLPNVRRKKLLWTECEEEMLKQGVQKFSTSAEKIPWRKILDYGRHVFDKTRTPIDLKDKWRNILAKETR